jgi:hypothetical protein
MNLWPGTTPAWDNSTFFTSENEIPLALHVSLAELLRAPSTIRQFWDFLFTSTLCQATANGIMEGAR